MPESRGFLDCSRSVKPSIGCWSSVPGRHETRRPWKEVVRYFAVTFFPLAGAEPKTTFVTPVDAWVTASESAPR
jgi:hypothetical protein